jgi:hypothetical protein
MFGASRLHCHFQMLTSLLSFAAMSAKDVSVSIIHMPFKHIASGCTEQSGNCDRERDAFHITGHCLLLVILNEGMVVCKSKKKVKLSL